MQNALDNCFKMDDLINVLIPYYLAACYQCDSQREAGRQAGRKKGNVILSFFKL